MIFPILFALAASSGPSPTIPLPKVGHVPLAEVARFAEVIVVGRVEEIFEISQEPRLEGEVSRYPEPIEDMLRVPVAKVRVERALKGVDEGEVVYYLATSTWACDLSSAKLGERALFLLTDSAWHHQLRSGARGELARRTASAPVYQLAHAGRGRLPLREVEGSEYATCRPEVILPEDLSTIAGPEGSRSSIRSAHLPSLEKRLAEIDAGQLPYFSLSHRHPLTPDRGWRLRVWGDGHGYLIIEDPRQKQYIESELPSTAITELGAALRVACASDLSGPFGQGGPDGSLRTFEARTAESRVRFEIHTLGPGAVVGEEAREQATRALELWARVRGLFDQPRTLDARDRDRALIDGW